MILSSLVVVHNEEERLAACLDKLAFADEIVVVLDKCTDGSKSIALSFTDRLVEGSWELEGPRRNSGIDACRGDWILEVDADEHVTPDLAAEIRRVVENTPYDYHILSVDNWIGRRLVRHGWGASFGKAAYTGLFRRGAKRWGNERVHPKLTLVGRKGPALAHPIQHYVDRNISDTIRRFDAYSTARAKDLRELGRYRLGLSQCPAHLLAVLALLCAGRRLAGGRPRPADRRLRRALSAGLLSQGQARRPMTKAVSQMAPAHIVMTDDGIDFDGRVKDEQPLGGAETAFAGLAEAFAGRGHRVEVVCRCQAPLEWNGVSWTPLADGPTRGVPEAADLYIANRSNHLIGLCPRARRRVFWIHNPARYLLKWRYQWPLWRYRPVIVFSGASHLSSYPAWAADGGRQVIPYGITPLFLGAGARTEAPPPRAIFLSNPLRSLDWLLEVWASDIQPMIPAAELHVFAGAAIYGSAAKADRMAPVLDQARRLAGQGVVLRGPLPKSRLVEEIRQARVFLYRGDEGETFCNAAAEPQAMGLPGVVEDIACMKERVVDGETGFVVRGRAAFARAAVRLLTDDVLWRRMHAEGLARQGRWTWQDAAAGFEALLA